MFLSARTPRQKRSANEIAPGSRMLDAVHSATMSSRKWSLPLLLCLALAPACRRGQHASPQSSGETRGPVIDSHTLIAPVDESIDTALAIFKRVGVVKFCNKNGGYLGSRG